MASQEFLLQENEDSTQFAYVRRCLINVDIHAFLTPDLIKQKKSKMYCFMRCLFFHSFFNPQFIFLLRHRMGKFQPWDCTAFLKLLLLIFIYIENTLVHVCIHQTGWNMLGCFVADGLCQQIGLRCTLLLIL